MTDDGKIIELFMARNEQAIDELSKKYGAVCKSVSLNILKNAQDAEECVNDTYLAVWNAIPPAHPDPLRAYILRIVRNLSIKKYHANSAAKRNSHYDAALDELDECLFGPDSVERELESSELSCHLDAFLDTLDRNSRVMFVRRYWYSDSVSEIAQKFGMSAHNVSVRLSRIREKLKKYLKKAGFEI